MQSYNELLGIITKGRPEIELQKASMWADLLSQLNGCHLYSLAAPENDKEEWLRERRAGIGGSEIAAILGENHWNSPRQIWMSKTGMLDDKPAQQSEAARWGNLLETTVADEWAFRTKRKYVHIPVILQDDDRPWLLANIDGFTVDEVNERLVITGILEIKTTSTYNKKVWEEGPVPFHYVCQTNWYCGITRLKNYTIVCLVGGQNLFWYDLPADAELFDREVKAADDFWCNYVQKLVEPPMTEVDSKLMKQDLQENEKSDVPPVVLQDDESDRVVGSYIQIGEKIKALKDVQGALKAEIQKMLGKSPELMTKQHTVTISVSNRRKCDFDLLQSIAPEIYATVISESTRYSMNIS